MIAFALVNGKLEEVKIMEKGGGNLFMVLPGENTLLHLIVSIKQPTHKQEILNYLLSKGLPVDSKNIEV